jgi:hypothetical protein
MSSNEEIIKKYWEDPRTGFISAINLHKKIKPLYPNITLREIKEFINSQTTAQIHNQKKIKLEDYNQITAKTLGFFQIDIIDMSNYKSHNDNYRYIFIATDIKSRYTFMEKMKTKTADETFRIFMKFYYYCESVGNRIYAIYADKGGEFKKIENSDKEYHFKVFYKTPNTHRGSGIVDRRIRWFRELIEKYFTQNNTLNWIDTYQLINNNQNNTINKNTKETPQNIWNKKAESKQEIKKVKPVDNFRLNDWVRVRLDTNNLSKNSTGLFSNKSYQIKEIDGLGFKFVFSTFILINTFINKYFYWIFINFN